MHTDDTSSVQIVFELADGSQQTHIGKVGETVMDVALDNIVVGIKAQCGGGCTCCTCHCYIPSPWFAQLNAPHSDELDMLAYAWQPHATSRLACQVELTPELDGMHVRIPAQQS